MRIDEIKKEYNNMLDDWDDEGSIEQRIHDARFDSGVLKTIFIFTEESLDSLLKQVTKEQKEIIAKGLPDRCFVDIDESWITSMPSPLD